MSTSRCCWLVACLVLSITGSAIAATQVATVGGPFTFVRGTGKPLVQTASFTVAAAGAASLMVENGPAQGARASSCVIKVNGNLVLGPESFNQKVQKLTVPVQLVAGTNVVSVELRSQPGATIEVAFSMKLQTCNPMTITWDPSLYNHGQNVYELQVIRDQDAGSAGAFPVRAITDISQWNAGFTDLSNLYGNGMGTPVTFYRMDLGATTPTTVAWTVPAEGYGVTHQYQLRALLRVQTGVDGQGSPVYRYSFTTFGNAITATAIEPIKADKIISPLNGDLLVVSQLLTGDANLVWASAVGTDQYRVIVEPVQPGTGPTWQSSIIFAGSGAEVSLPDTDRLALASQLSSPLFLGTDMKWHVDGRRSGDTCPGWTIGDTVIFRISDAPGGPP